VPRFKSSVFQSMICAILWNFDAYLSRLLFAFDGMALPLDVPKLDRECA
jgi:hypothetical protein